MRKSQLKSNSPSNEGNGTRLGVRTRKKHKKLDAINEDEFIRNREVKVELNEGNSGGEGHVIDNESDLRRSSRARRAPVILDSSPPPARKRRKIEELGKSVSGVCVKKGKGKGKVKVNSPPLSSGKGRVNSPPLSLGKGRFNSPPLSSGNGKVKSPLSLGKGKVRSPPLGSGNEKVQSPSLSSGKVKAQGPSPSSLNTKEERRVGVRSSGRSGTPSLVYRRNQPRGKRKLIWDDEEGVKDEKDEQEDGNLCLEGEKSRIFKSSELESGRASVDGDDERVEEGCLDNGVDGSRGEVEGDANCTPSMSGRVVGHEEILSGSPNHFVEKEGEGLVDIRPEEKSSKIHNVVETMIDNVVENEQKHTPLDSVEVNEDAEKERLEAEATAVSTGSAEDLGRDALNEVVSEANQHRVEVENGANFNVISGGTPRSRVKKGRRCGLCGGGTDGKPPKIMANDSAESDDDGYSGSSASEECSYDPWDGFGDEPGWLGRLLGPVNDRYGIAGIWVHQHCAVWSPEVYFAGLGCLKNIKAALCRGRALKCTRCGRPGATLGCRVDRCPRTYHLPCARASGCIFDHRKFLIACADHRYLFEPHGLQYAQRIKKLKARKMKMEIRKQSNDASRKDLEAEEKWLEKCGEDEEFLRRETKRLQRDLLRIAPVYIGGPNSGDENPFEGWESVAGLKDVIQCMKEVVILPLLYPEFFGNMGITPPRGVLLHGYPGTGKTLIVRALIGSCARGDKRIAYFARKGADCLGKYVGDAERQLRLLFQVAEKSQPSIIFFDEIDGLAPVRTRQQDQTHSSVVSTLLALMDGLKSRGSVIVIGATNRPDAVDPALRRPGRFDREIYFPLPSMKDRAAILSLHTKKWPKPVSGTLLEWVAARTVGFAGADLQALCAQSAVIALKRNCSWHQILSFAEVNTVKGRRPHLPSFAVEERDWLEALSRAPPPCSRREAGMAANEVVGFPLHMHLIPFLLKPLLSLIISLYLDDRLWLPHSLINAGAAIQKVVLSLMEKKGMQSDNWWCHIQDIVQYPDATKEVTKNLVLAGILDGDVSLAGRDLPNATPFGDDRPRDLNCTFGSFRNLCQVPSPKAGYRMLISGEPRSGQKHLASCLLHCFVGGVEMQKIDLATVSQEGHGDMELGISQILMKCSSVKLCALFMPRIDLWAIQSCLSVEEGVEAPTSHQSFEESSSAACQMSDEKCSSKTNGSELMEVTESQYEIFRASQIWRSFVEQLEYICVSSSLIILATSELPNSSLPRELRQFFGSELLTSQGSVFSKNGTARFAVEMERDFDHDNLIHSSASNLSRDLIQQFVQLVHATNHCYSDSRMINNSHDGKERDVVSARDDEKLIEEAPMIKSECSISKLPVSSGSKSSKGKSSLILAITALGYQILKYPHFAELCWVTSKLNEGPSADIHGPWKGWPFNSCIVRPCKSMAKEIIANNANNNKGKDQFTLVRGLIAVGLTAYRGIYSSAIEVSLEVRKVLELLIRLIASRIQAGKDRNQYFRLLSQVAYLEDMINSWSHSLISLESDAQTSNLNSKLNSTQYLKTLQPLADNTKEVGDLLTEEQLRITFLSTLDANFKQVEESNVIGCDFEQTELEGQRPVAEGSHPIDSNMTTIDVEGRDVVEVVNLNEGSSQNTSPKEETVPREVLLRDNPLSNTDIKDSVIDQSCSTILGGPRLESAQVAFFESLGQGTLNKTGLHVSSELCGDLGTESSVENEISYFEKSGSGMQLHDVRTTERSGQLSESEVICCYSCCLGCISTLNQLVKNIITRELKMLSSSCTIEDVHDLISALSSSMCSFIRNLHLTEGENERELETKANGCLCRQSSDNKQAVLKECVCHSAKGFCKSVNISSFNQPESELNLTFTFRDGVFVSAIPGRESFCHCKYDTFCLCSLIEFMVGMKQHID